MMKLMVVPGIGRVHRSDRAVAFCSGQSPDLAAIIQDSDSQALFQKLAMLVVSTEFKHSPFMVLRLGEERTMFLFGDLDVKTGDECFNGTTATTWIEMPVATGAPLRVGDTNESSNYEDCDLQSGTVAGSGFVLVPGGLSSTRETSLPTATSDPGTPEGVPIGIKPLEDTSSARESVQTKTVVELIEVEDNDDFDPFEDPQTVDLDSIGTVIVAETESQPSEDQDCIPQPEVPEVDLDLEDMTIPPSHEDDLPELRSKPLNLRAAPTTIPAPAGASSPPVPKLRSAPSNNPTPKTGLATIRVDDGQVVQFAVGLYIGRYPGKQGVPAGYDELVVQGEEISRVHWALTIEPSGAVAVEDLGSTSGTTTIGADGIEQPLAKGARRIVGPNTKILFGNRWVLFER